MANHAIVVGINRYPYLTNSLQGAVADAEDFYSWVIDANGGAVSPPYAKKILSTDYVEDFRPMTGDIDMAFRNLLAAPIQANGYVGERLYVYTSGHGIAPEADDSALLTADAATQTLGNHVAARGYSNAIRINGLFKEVVLFMDCCRDTADDFPRRLPPFSIRSTGLRSTSYFGFATDWDSQARESQIDGKTRGLFTTALLAALRSGAVDGEQLDNHVKTYIRILTNGTKQDPEFFSSDKRAFKFSASAQPFSVPVEINFDPTVHRNSFEIWDSQFHPLPGHSTVASAAPWHIQLTCGIYAVASGGAPVKMFTVVGQYKQTVTVPV